MDRDRSRRLVFTIVLYSPVRFPIVVVRDVAPLRKAWWVFSSRGAWKTVTAFNLLLWGDRPLDVLSFGIGFVSHR